MIEKRLGLATLKYQKLENLVNAMKAAIGLAKDKLCTYCRDGCEPGGKVTTALSTGKRIKERRISFLLFDDYYGSRATLQFGFGYPDSARRTIR